MTADVPAAHCAPEKVNTALPSLSRVPVTVAPCDTFVPAFPVHVTPPRHRARSCDDPISACCSAYTGLVST